MRATTPHFIDVSKANAQPLTPEEQKIKDDVVAIFVAGQPGGKDYYSNLWLDAVGSRYVLVTQPQAGSSFDAIVDSQTGTVTLIPGDWRFYLAFEDGRNTALYVTDPDIYTYTLNQASYSSVPNAKLTGTETYQSGKSEGPSETEEQTHTDTSITINVFDTTKRVPNPSLGNGATMNGKVREVTLTF